MTTVTINSNTYSDDGSEPKDMLNKGYALHFFPLVGDVVTVAAEVAAVMRASISANSSAWLSSTATVETSVSAIVLLSESSHMASPNAAAISANAPTTIATVRQSQWAPGLAGAPVL